MRLKKSIILGLGIVLIFLLFPTGITKSAKAYEGDVGGIYKMFSNADFPGSPAKAGKVVGGMPLPLAQEFNAHISGAYVENSNGAGKTDKHTTNTNGNANASSITKCISNSPDGTRPHITKHGNVIIGSDCDITIKGDNQGDIIFTGNGNDVVYGGTGNDLIYAGSGTVQIYGGGGKDLLAAGSGTDLLDGGPGDDVLIGGTGNDLLIGGPGNDKLFAGTSTTVMEGGPGADHFDCGTTNTAKAVVMDYNPTEGDTISGNCKLVNDAPH